MRLGLRKVQGNNTVGIPKEVRKLLDAESGDYIVYLKDDKSGNIILKKGEVQIS